MTRRDRAPVATLGVAALALFALVLIARRPLLDRPFSLEGEAREATCIADVVREDHWIAPYPNGDWVPTKGPLLYWWAGAAASVFGLSERVFRLSVAALNLGTLLATAWLGHLLGSARAGWLAGAMLATCFLFSGYAFYLRVDPALVLCTTLSLACFAWGLARPTRRRVAFLVSHVALAGALFAKGLPALLPTLLPILVLLAWRRDAPGLRTWGFSALLLGAIAAAKFSDGRARASSQRRRGWRCGPGFALRVRGAGAARSAPGLRALRPARRLAGTRGRALPGSVSVPRDRRQLEPRWPDHARRPLLKPPWFYLPRFPADFFPWSLFLPAAVVAAVRVLRRDPRDLRLLPLLCALGGFIVFSPIAYKRKVYLLPFYPAAAVLVGLLFASDSEPRRRESHGMRSPGSMPPLDGRRARGRRGVCIAARPRCTRAPRWRRPARDDARRRALGALRPHGCSSTSRCSRRPALGERTPRVAASRSRLAALAIAIGHGPRARRSGDAHRARKRGARADTGRLCERPCARPFRPAPSCASRPEFATRACSSISRGGSPRRATTSWSRARSRTSVGSVFHRAARERLPTREAST